MRIALALAAAAFFLVSCVPPSLPSDAGSSEAALSSFAIVAPPATGAVDAQNRCVQVPVPWDTDCRCLVATFAIRGHRVTVGGVEQESGVTANDFSQPVSYIVEAEDGTTVAYQVTVAPAARPRAEKEITQFGFLQPPVVATVDEASHAISAVVPRGTDRSSLVAQFATTGCGVSVADTEQESGVTVNDFTEPVTYVVRAEDGSTQSYVVTVQEAPSQEKALTAFCLRAPGSVTAIDEEHRIIRVRVSDGTDLSSLVAEFTTTGAAVRVCSVAQESGVTANDFTRPVDYEVDAEDGSTVSYSVRVTGRIALLLNEIDADQVGTDSAEFVELCATGPVDLWGIAVIFLNGGVTPGQEYARVDLSPAGIVSAGTYVVIAGPAVSVAPGAVKLTPAGWDLTNRIQNGPSDAVLLWDTLGRRVVDTVSYAGVLHRAVVSGESTEVDATEGSAGAPADSNTVNGSIARSPDGRDTGQNGTDFKFCQPLTPGSPNP
ncbi:MAG TPA: hypothetical protein VFI08_05105 [Spirochaetia bacterium]|nr:hypothetical protein [Spirochaetia bacterium]